jgi:hypothetical protein
LPTKEKKLLFSVFRSQQSNGTNAKKTRELAGPYQLILYEGRNIKRVRKNEQKVKGARGKIRENFK